MVTKTVAKKAASKKPASKPAARKKATPKTAASSASANKMGMLPSLDDLGKLVGKLKLPGVNVAAIVESQRKDMEALAEANKQAYEGIKALAKRRNEILKEALVQWQAAMVETSLSKEGLTKSAQSAKKGVEQAIANVRELAEMEAQSRSKAWKIVQDRFQENLVNLQKLLQPK